ncbi:thiamine/thiamine pyrophosphate ABC transporter permease [Pararhizobium mangrovi]|uniref:Thiamine transport system permease protein ThiP n=1 Tax=Pararhizobium mangrovi TaxID=2590452 RepID=A0A506UA26_9HYPH|nr:thiamine/thiamine pyrophosphate ABC transporter permease [Pararhizobium mangrovi]TPW30730.1 thiamine/thiamine pyrophosphate ABC transporter, permease protein [Pararhizobium mangrovi]
MLTNGERRRWIVGGGLALALMAALVLAAVVPLLVATAGGAEARSATFDTYIWRVTRFTLLQAGLSTLLSVALAIPVTSALARRRRFFGREWLVRLLAVPLGLPQIVATLGLLAVWGRQGLVNEALLAAGAGYPVSIYGLPGILLAHVFFNMPLAARLMLFEVERTPGEYWALAGQLSMRRSAVFRLIEWPAIARVLPGAAGLVFMLCATSFTIVLLIGGGPGATTIEVAIYQALRFDFDPPRAVVLGLFQIVLTGLVLVALKCLGGRAEHGGTSGRAVRRQEPDTALARTADGTAIALGAAFLLAPMAAIAVDGLRADLLRLLGEGAVWRAIGTSLAIAFVAGCLGVLLALVLAAARHAALPLAMRHASARAFCASTGAASSLILLVPPIVLGAGWFVALHGVTDVFALAPVVVVIINAMMALPFVVRVVEPALASHRARTGRLALSLGISGWRRMRLVDWPGLRRPLFVALAFAMALSLGDLGAIALFGGQGTTTLPYLLLQRMGSYRTADASGLALLLAIVCLALMTAGSLGTREEERPW